jgi:nucleotide-binding universal stress UspA family protein
MPGKAGGRFPVYANEDELQAKIEREVTKLSADGVPAKMRMARTGVGEAARVIAEAAREEEGEVIVVGTRGRGPLSGLLLGSVTQRLLHIAPCPVLAVPTRNGAP